MGERVEGLLVRDQGLDVRVRGLKFGLRVEGARFRSYSLGVWIHVLALVPVEV